MKMRIQGSAIRFRLNRSEVSEIGNGGRVRSGVEFPGGRNLTYSVEASDGGAIAASFDRDAIRVRIPGAIAREWAAGDQVGIYENAQGLDIAVEKDFQCLHKGESGRDADAFPNPIHGEQAGLTGG